MNAVARAMIDTGTIVWLTGLPDAGKSTLANHLRERFATRMSCVVLDDEELRGVLDGHGDDDDRFHHALGHLAVMLARQGHVVLVAATAPRREHRDAPRLEAPSFVEVYVQSARDPGDAGDVAYEPPFAPEVIAQGGFDAPAATEIDRLVTCNALARLATV